LGRHVAISGVKSSFSERFDPRSRGSAHKRTHSRRM
jgi:hypothetical protein